jgi:RNA polymerase sigma factor FliA
MNAATKPAPSKNQTTTDNARRDALIVEHLPLVTAIAAHVQRSLPVHTELDDLVHAGMMGLLDAATKYQDDKEVAFPAYAKHRIKGAILDSACGSWIGPRAISGNGISKWKRQRGT